ncbi:hypothetical protein [Novacetimonas pomaceti]|uniref:hypothetical protein n=1 Tax=Novacetimonas pomaceti TaxID=2021998 RepID=UPI001C2CCE99|nr:hypothetical protein [Novacetimonas pomaceti]MBV1832939.1 hypothetical protein [Novacetimonas pomaceti]
MVRFVFKGFQESLDIIVHQLRQARAEGLFRPVPSRHRQQPGTVFSYSEAHMFGFDDDGGAIGMIANFPAPISLFLSPWCGW